MIRDDAMICSKCCSEIRGDHCHGCEYYSSTQQYALSKKVPSSDFIIMIDPEIDEKVDKALDLFEKGQFLTAEIEVIQLLKEYPDYHQTNYAMGVIHIHNKKFDEALRYLDKTTDISPIFSEAFYNKALIHKERLKLGMMASNFLSVMKIESSDSELYQRAKEFIDILAKDSNGVIEDYIEAD